jgi:hypothetical protein
MTSRSPRIPWGRYGGPGRISCCFMRFWSFERIPSTDCKYCS